jgi:hypothetical protein
MNKKASILLLAVLLNFVVSLDSLDEAERRMNELLNGEASPWRYIVGTVAIIAFICVACGFVIWLFYLSCLCCKCFGGAFRGLWRFLRWIFSCCCGKKETYGCLSTYAPYTGEFEEADFPCAKKLARIKNASGVQVEIPYCSEHVNPLVRRVFVRGAPFEKGNKKYPINFEFGKSKKSQTVIANIEAEIVRAEKVPVRQPGFIYRFEAEQDVAIVDLPGADKPYLYKIGMTRQKSAKDRTSQWPESVFGNVENVDYWKTNDAPSAESLIHAFLAKKRLMRFNTKTQDFEIEWFYVTLNELTETVEFVINSVASNDWKRLRDKSLTA